MDRAQVARMNFMKTWTLQRIRCFASSGGMQRQRTNALVNPTATLLPDSRLWVWINTVKYSDWTSLHGDLESGNPTLKWARNFRWRWIVVCLRHGAPWPSNGFLMVFDTSQRCLLALGEMGEMSEMGEIREKKKVRGLHRFWIIQCHILVYLGYILRSSSHSCRGCFLSGIGGVFFHGALQQGHVAITERHMKLTGVCRHPVHSEIKSMACQNTVLCKLTGGIWASFLRILGWT